MPFSVRYAKWADRAFVGQDHYIPEKSLRRKIQAGEIIIALKNDEPAGYLRLDYLWSMVPYIALIWVERKFRQKGCGKALLNFVEITLKEQGHALLFSSSQVDEAEPQAWHRHMGFEECGVINGINEGGIGEIFFRKKLKEDPHDG
jgi:GNAT superfamily N-acetyltransferase